MPLEISTLYNSVNFTQAYSANLWIEHVVSDLLMKCFLQPRPE